MRASKRGARLDGDDQYFLNGTQKYGCFGATWVEFLVLFYPGTHEGPIKEKVRNNGSTQQVVLPS